MRTQKISTFSSQAQPQDIRDKIIEAVLPEIPFDGWTWPAVEQAAVKSGYEATMASSVFPGGLPDALDHFADLADRWMLARLAGMDPETLRVRDRVRMAVMARFRSLYPWRDAVRQSATYWMMPTRAGRGGKITWRTADRIWDWAGDTSTDYNRYTKRTLLFGVLVSTMLAWLNDDSSGMIDTEEFLDRRISAVMTIGKAVGKAKSFTNSKMGRNKHE